MRVPAELLRVPLVCLEPVPSPARPGSGWSSRAVSYTNIVLADTTNSGTTLADVSRTFFTV